MSYVELNDERDLEGSRHVVLLTSTSTSPKNVEPTSRSTASANKIAVTPAQVATWDANPRPDPALPTAVQELLPSVQGEITNWKEFKPQKITIAPYPDMPIEFEATSISEESGRTVWTGRNAIDGAFLVAAATETDWHATLVIPPADAFEIHIAGSTVTMLGKNHEAEVCGTQLALAAPLAADISGAARDFPQVPDAAAEDSWMLLGKVVDVLFFYDADTLAAVGTQANFDTRMISYIASSNASLANSRVTEFQWRFLASYQVPAYAATEDMTNDLNIISALSSDRKPAPNPVNEFITQKAVLHGADQVVLYVGGKRNYGGIAWLPAGMDPGTLALVYHSSVVAANPSYTSLTHELAHNFGCRHDRQETGATDGNGLYYYGHRFPDRFGRDTGTIMSYATFEFPYFSNPDITVSGYVLGVPEDQPKAANNSRVLREASAAMILSRATIASPLISTQPQSVTVSAGQPFTMSVTAQGGNLLYQWKLAGVDIPGANGSTFSKTATANDAGAYTVRINNVVGQATSEEAMLTVNAAAPPAPAPSSGGGGGGGGATGPWFAAVCGVLLALRQRLKKQDI